MFKYVCKNCHTISASYSAANAIARHSKPFQEGEFLKEVWLACVPSLFDDFDNKHKIIQRIKDLSLSRSTIKDIIVNNYKGLRYLYGSKKLSLAEKEINLKKIVSVTTDGAPNMVRYHYKKLQILLHSNLKKNIKDLDAQEKRNEETIIDEFISINDSLVKEFSARFSQYKELSETFRFIMYPDVILFDKLNLSQFDWLKIEEPEMQLIDFQSSSIWIQKSIETRKKL
ncbi:uncharacterized protein TNCV_2313121 [Trichonephila clavipes]|nr:uncharacterized protein TNCV_2313121 [Trichonephila clavipes]